MGRVAEAVRPKSGGGGEAIQALRVDRLALPTRSLRDHPPHEGEGETQAQSVVVHAALSLAALFAGTVSVHTG